MNLNKKAGFGVGLFWFFFSFMLVSGIMFFILTAFPAILHTYGIQTAVDVNQDLVDLGVSSNSSQTNINQLSSSFKNLYTYADYFFLFILVSAFIESITAASTARRTGIFSFFGYITIGNVFLIFILSYAIHIRGWFLNEIVYNILTISIETRFFDWFFNYSYYIGMIWFIILLFVNLVDFKSLMGRLPFVDQKDSGRMRFEE
jgi:hypothetical protein